MLVVAGLLVASPVWAKPALSLVGPATVTGDGTTAVQLTVTSAHQLPSHLDEIHIGASGGTVGDKQRGGPRRLLVSWTPPKLAFTRRVTVRARWRRGHHTYKSEHDIVVEPAKRVVGQIHSAGVAGIATPASAVLGKDKSFVVRLTPVTGAIPRLHVNVGSLSGLRRLGKKGAALTYTMPVQKYPQQAIFVATDRAGRPIDWLAVPLYGQAQVRLATEPKADVTVKVGSVEYGPIVADAKGHAQVGIFAPPGLPRVLGSARDRLGNIKRKPVSLGAPAYSQVTTICPKNADRVYAVGVGPTGGLLPPGEVEFRSKRATFGAPARAPGGAIQSLLTVAAGTQLGDKVAVVAHRRGNDVRGSRCVVHVQGGPVERVNVVAGARAYVAGSRKTVKLRISLRDATGKPAQPALPTVEVDTGSIGKLTLAKGATYVAVWTLPDRFGGRQQAELHARVAGKVSPPLKLALRSGAIATIDMTSDRYILAADGTTSTTVHAQPYDAYGNPAPPNALVYRARGKLVKLSAPSRMLQLRYRSVALRTRVVDEVVVQDPLSNAVGRLFITLTPDLGSVAVTARLGVMTDFGDLLGPSLIAGAQLRTPLLSGRVFGRLQLGLGRFSNTATAVMPAGERVTETVTLVPVLAGGYVDIISAPVPIYAGLSGGAVYSAVGIESPTTGRVVNTSLSWGIAGAVGTNFPAGPGNVTVELSQLLANVNAAPRDELTPITQLAAGYQLRF